MERHLDPNKPTKNSISMKLHIIITLMFSTFWIVRCDLPTPSVTIPGFGTVNGVTNNGVDEFLGLPFAQPPVGENRWRPPQPLGHSNYTNYSAASFKSPCAQIPSIEFGYITGSSEDCLYLNVYRRSPADTYTNDLPVMVFFYGGAMVAGATSQPLYNGSRLSLHSSVIIVVVAYRVGPFGGLYLNELVDEDGIAGNYQLQDQISSLQWVNQNIKYFGGNPNNVTIFGQSAGGSSICSHLLIKESWGYYGKAIVESAPCIQPFPSIQSALSTGNKLVQALNCSNTTTSPVLLQCIRNKTMEQVLNALPDTIFGTGEPSWYPVIEPILWNNTQPAVLLKQGKFNKVPIMMGNTYQEQGLLLWQTLPVNLTVDQYNKFLEFICLKNQTCMNKINELYPLSDYPSPYYDALQQLSDLTACEIRWAADLMSEAGNSPYVYSFNYAPTQQPEFVGSCHGSELAFVWGNPYWMWRYKKDFTKEELPLVSEMMDLWTNFAKTGSPAATSTWNLFSNQTQNVYLIDLPQSKQESSYLEEKCQFWFVYSKATSPF